MTNAHELPQELQQRFKKPWGTLVRGSYNETASKLREIIKREKPPSIVSVGDAVSKNLVEHEILPNLMIVDNKVMRTDVEPFSFPADKELSAKNPPGTITQEALDAVREAFKSNCRVKIVIEGEEDLLTIASVYYAPENSIIVYGQPREGVVVVKVTQENKAEAAEILKIIEKLRKG